MTAHETVVVDGADLLDDLEAEMDEIAAEGDAVDEKIEEVEARIRDREEPGDVDDRLVDEVEDLLSDDGRSDVTIDDLPGAIDALETRYRNLAEEYEEVEHTHEVVQRRFEEWGTDGEPASEFEIRKFGWTDEGRVADMVRSDMVREGESDPRTKIEAMKIRTVQIGVVRTPPGCPEDPNDPSFPPALGEWLYDRIDNFNRFGEVSLDDFSLSRRLTEDDGPPN